jgi:hypothetical protein
MPATLSNERFEMKIAVAGYEFPDNPRDAYDANWLVIRVTLAMPFGAWRWQVEDAGALTWELADCIAWLDRLSRNEPVDAERIGFSEPDISFETIRDSQGQVVGLKLQLMDEFQPPTKVLVPHENNVATLDFNTPPEILQAFSQGLAAELARFPQRGARPTV